MLHSTTIIARSSSTILSYIARIKSEYGSRPNTLLFALSSPSVSSELSSLVNALVTFSPSSVGCLSAPMVPGHIACSIALLEAGKATPFRSTIQGQEKTQVGRWHAFRKKDHYEDVFALPQGNINWDHIWDSKTKGHMLPDELAGLEREPSSVVYFTDHAPEGLSASLFENYPGASQLGLLASSTPFITGRPVTLFHNQQIHDTGAVGIALSSRAPPLELTLPADAEPLGEVLEVTASEGNLINSLNSSNPTQQLLSRIRAAGIDTLSSLATGFKDDMEFFLGVLPRSDLSSSSSTFSSPPSASSPSASVFLRETLYQLHTITAGDPSRGTLSLNTQSLAPTTGSRVRFFYRRAQNHSLGLTYSSAFREALPPRTLTFTTVSKALAEGNAGQGDEVINSNSVAKKPEGAAAEERLVVLPDRFIVGSENGFVLGRAEESPWLCTVPGCGTMLGYPSVPRQ